MHLSGPGETQPEGVLSAPAGHGRRAEVEHHQGKATFEQHLGGGEGVFDAPGAGPQQAFQVHSGELRPGRVEAVAEIDQGLDVAAARVASTREKRPEERAPTSSTRRPRSSPPPSRRSISGKAVGNAGNSLAERARS
jgi:hypothetical protein